MKQYTDITILLDRSGSMSLIQSSMESAINEFVQKHKENPSTRLTFIQFDDQDDQDVLFKALPIKSVEKIQINPRGWTPLLDALCKAIDSTGRRLRDMPSSERPDQVLMLVITDGAENHSKQYRRADVKSRIEKQQNEFNWQFVYLGSNQDAFSEAQSFGINPNWVLNYTSSNSGVNGMSAALIGNTVAYTSTSGASRSSNMRKFSDEQRAQADDSTTKISTT